MPLGGVKEQQLPPSGLTTAFFSTLLVLPAGSPLPHPAVPTNTEVHGL